MRSEIRVNIASSRSFGDKDAVIRELDKVVSDYPNDTLSIVSGGLTEADKIAEEYAKHNKLTVLLVRPRWDLYGSKASLIHNQQIRDTLSEFGSKGLLIAFWDNQSSGVRKAIEKARAVAINTRVINL